jgi:uncharacterized protein
MATPRVKVSGAIDALEPQVSEAKENPPRHAAEPFRILALDGGPAALLVVLMLNELEDIVPGFLEKVDLIAGTSAGAITGLMLSTKRNPAYMLPVAENFWLNEQNYYKNGPVGYLKALIGAGAVNDSKYVQQFLEQRGVLANRKLRELAKKVLVTSFELNPIRRAPGMRGPLNWQPKILHNLSNDGHDLDLPAVDAALSSSASPIITAIHQGKVDGGLVANNPSMVAITQVLMEAMRPVKCAEGLPRDRHGIALLSIGGGRAHDVIEVTDNSWGYAPWLLNPSNPLLLLNAFLTGSSEVVTYEAAAMLDAPRFFRLDPFYTEPGLLPFVQASPKKQQNTAASPETHEMVQQAARFLRHSGWMGEHEQRLAAAASA